ncbi:MAG: glycosyltransferase [Lachnospiraceae bacterium]|nr:glycosyltransferase [Lachnospiraceae bacterium]
MNCVESITAQTYQNMEIILVDDGNTEDYAIFIAGLKEKDKRIIVYRHDKNRGLFQARLTGVALSKSEYIAFVDADDAITIDWIRVLVKNAEENHADIVLGKTICMDEHGWKYIFNSNYSSCMHENLNKKQIFEFFIKGCGLDFSIHTVWNKLYSRNLWDRAWKDLNKHEQHLIMTEDILFSCILFYHAQTMSFSNHEGYIYYRNVQSSTLNTGTANKCKKNIEDLSYVFQNIKKFMENKGIFCEYKCFYEEWLNRYFRLWSSIVEENCKNGNEESLALKARFLEVFGKKDYEYGKLEDSCFTQKKTGWNCALENVKRAIASKECKAVSFDLFDTLLVRPVLYPEDVYEIVLSETDIYPYDANIIAKYRKLAEEQARDGIHKKFPQYEDVTLSEIYEVMVERYGVDNTLCEKLKKREIETELEFAVKRQTGAELFELAIALKKEIFIISDMYLEKPDIERMLQQNGYEGYKKIYLSSEERLLKSTGHLFELFISEVDVKEANLVHIGDNWQTDAVIPADKGIKSFFLPKTKDILFNYLGDVYTGNSIGTAIDNKGSVIDYSKYFDSLAVRCMYAVAANIMFDNPYVSFNKDSDYNGDPYFLGCVPVGMHMFGISMWLLEQVKCIGYETVHFVARDGFYLKRIYDLLREKTSSLKNSSNYLYISRKSLIPIEISKTNFVDRILTSCKFDSNTPRTIINRYHAVLKPLTEELVEEYRAAGFLMGKKFQNEDELAVFINVLKTHQFSEEKAKLSIDVCREYLRKNVGKNDLIFDLGYSGKLHQYIVEALGENVAGAYINMDGYNARRRIDKNSLVINSYYDFIPSMEGIVNEYIFSDRNPSCVGYSKECGMVKPFFEEKGADFIGDYVVKEINRGTYKFAEEFVKFFGKRTGIIKLQPLDASILYESFLAKPKQFDQSIFDGCMIEDEFYGGIKQKLLNEVWDWQRDDRKLNGSRYVQAQAEYAERITDKTPENLEYEVYLKNVHSRNLIVKGLYWFCVDKGFFKKRLSEYIKRQAGEKT